MDQRVLVDQSRLVWGQSLEEHQGCLPTVLGRPGEARTAKQCWPCRTQRAVCAQGGCTSSSREQEAGNDLQVLCTGVASDLSSQR